MSLLTIERTYKDGRIELAEHPDWPEGEARVLITFLPGSRSGPTPNVEVDHDREALRQRAFAAHGRRFAPGRATLSAPRGAP